MTCDCHNYHLGECSKCYLGIHDTFTESAIRDSVVDYFHRFGMPNDRMGSFYYPLIQANALQNIETIFYVKHLRFIEYLFRGLSTEKIIKLFHSSIIQYIAKYMGFCCAIDLNKEGNIKWRIHDI